MDAALRVDSLSEQTRRFFERYLYFDVGGREHISVLFYDRPLPAWFLEGIDAVAGTRWQMVDARTVESQRRVLAELWAPEQRYVSVHDYVVDTFFPATDNAVRFAEAGRGVDYTSFEFPRFDVSPEQMERLLAIYVRGNPAAHLRYADSFFELLDDDPGYSIRVRSGERGEDVLEVRGPEPWMELAGPLCEGNIRFAPGAELFYHGRSVSGTLCCRGGINLLPLRSNHVDVELCRRLLEMARQIPEDPIHIDVEDGRIVALRSSSTAAADFTATLSCDEAFGHVVEVGIGLSPTARPLIFDWAASSNEAVPGIHLGIGADPANTRRFKTLVHLDFVCPDVTIEVNGACFYDGSGFPCESTSSDASASSSQRAMKTSST